MDGIATPSLIYFTLSASVSCSGFKEIRPIAPPPSGSMSYINYRIIIILVIAT